MCGALACTTIHHLQRYLPSQCTSRYCLLQEPRQDSCISYFYYITQYSVLRIAACYTCTQRDMLRTNTIVSSSTQPANRPSSASLVPACCVLRAYYSIYSKHHAIRPHLGILALSASPVPRPRGGDLAAHSSPRRLHSGAILNSPSVPGKVHVPLQQVGVRSLS